MIVSIGYKKKNVYYVCKKNKTSNNVKTKKKYLMTKIKRVSKKSVKTMIKTKQKDLNLNNTYNLIRSGYLRTMQMHWYI